MARGGKRQGSGRKATASALRSRAIADKMAVEGVMPLEVLVTVMREEWAAFRQAQDDKDDDRIKKHRATAVQMANDAAPFLHPKLAPVDGKTGDVPKFILIDPCA